MCRKPVGDGAKRVTTPEVGGVGGGLVIGIKADELEATDVARTATPDNPAAAGRRVLARVFAPVLAWER
jgi:hypothetical protein